MATRSSPCKDHFTIDQKLGQHDLTKFYPISITIAHKAEEGERLSDKAVLLMPANDHGGNAKAPFAGAVFHKDGLYVEVDNDDSFINVSTHKGLYDSQEGHGPALEK